MAGHPMGSRLTSPTLLDHHDAHDDPIKLVGDGHN